ncbi:hypothetical protein [Aegicerativicinus sediminis]
MKVTIATSFALMCSVFGFVMLGCSVVDNPTESDDCSIFNWVYTDCDCNDEAEGCRELISTGPDELTRLENLLESSGEDCIYVENIRGRYGNVSGYIKAPLSTACLNFDWNNLSN